MRGGWLGGLGRWWRGAGSHINISKTFGHWDFWGGVAYGLDQQGGGEEEVEEEDCGGGSDEGGEFAGVEVGGEGGGEEVGGVLGFSVEDLEGVGGAGDDGGAEGDGEGGEEEGGEAEVGGHCWGREGRDLCGAAMG